MSYYNIKVINFTKWLMITYKIFEIMYLIQKNQKYLKAIPYPLLILK